MYRRLLAQRAADGTIAGFKRRPKTAPKKKASAKALLAVRQGKDGIAKLVEVKHMTNIDHALTTTHGWGLEVYLPKRKLSLADHTDLNIEPHWVRICCDY